MGGFTLMPLLSDPGWALALLAKSTVVLTVAGVVAFGLRRASASARHMVWALALGALALLPLLSVVLPRWKVPLLPPAPPPPVHAADTSVPRPKPPAPLAPAGRVYGLPEALSPRPAHEWPTAPPAARVTAVRDPPAWPRWAAAVWLAGVVLGLLQFLVGTLLVWRAARRASQVADTPWPKQLAEASLRLGVRRRIEIRMTDAVSVPVVWGLRRPVILVPRSAEHWSEEQRAAFLRHELAHVVRNDCVSQVIAVVVHALYWPHPLVWWTVRRLRAEAERACDDRVLAAGTNGPDYAQYLLDAARELRPTPWIPSGSSAVVERTHLGDRLLALLNEGMNRRAVGRRAVAMAGVLAVTAAAGLAALQPAARAAAVKAVRAVVAPLLPEQAVPKGSAKAPVPTPKPEQALGGTVKGPDGKPVEGAVVIVKPSREWLPPVTATTDADGRFRLPLPPRTSGPWDVTVDAKALATATLERVAGGSPLVVTLQKGGFITGTVRDGNDRRPLAGVRVVAALPSGWQYALPWQPSLGVKETETDRDGRFRIEGLARGRFEVTASTSGYGIGQRRNVAPGSSVDLLLFPGAAISGTVAGAGDRPVPGAVVVAQRRTTHGWAWGGAETTDARGRFLIAGAEAGSYLLLARHPQWAIGLAEATVEPLAESRVDFALRPGAPVLGRLVDEEDHPVAGKVVLQEIAGLALPTYLAGTLKVETGPDGIFVVERVPVGGSTFGITAPGFAPRRLDVEVGARDKSVDLGKVPLERGLTIAGRVTDRAGAPVADASLYAAPTTSATFANYTSSPDPVRSGVDGSFVIGGLETGVYNVTASAPGYVTVGQQVDAGSETPVRLVLAPAGGIAGTVVDARRRPVESFRVWAERTEQSGNGYGAGNTKDVTAPDGRFLLEELAEGTYIVRATAPDYAAGTVTGVKVVAARTADAGLIRLADGGVVRGSVVDTVGSPVAGAAVAAFAGSPWRDRVEGQCDASGLFELRGVASGRTTVSATHPSYAEGRVSDLAVDPAQGPTETRVVLSVGGRVQGSVRRRDGTPLGGLRVGVTPRHGEGDPRSSFPALYAVVQNDGSFAIDHVPPGPATATLSASPSPGVSLSVQAKEIVVVDGQTVGVDFTSREVFVSGHVTRGDAPLSDVRVTARTLAAGSTAFSMSMSADSGGVREGRPGPQYLTGVTGADGTYELILLGPGPGWVEVASLDGRVQYASRSLEVPDVESYSLDLRVGGAPVSGVVVDSESGKGIPRAHVQATAKRGEDRAAANAGPDGRFALELPPGEYRLTTSAEQYANDDSELSVTEGGAGEVRLELSRGLLLEGKLVDLSGRPAPRINLVARAGEAAPWAGMAVSMEDGSFRFEHLLPRAYALAGGSAATGFAIRAGVSPGDKDVVLTLRPGGRVRLTVADADGAPVADAIPSVTGVDGSKVNLFLSSSRTDAMGGVEFTAPQGLVEVEVRKSKGVGKATLQVEAGATVTARIVLGPAGGS